MLKQECVIQGVLKHYRSPLAMWSVRALGEEAGTAEYSESGFHAVMFANIGLQSNALAGRRRVKWLSGIVNMVKECMQDEDVLGMCLCEAGESYQGFTGAVREDFKSAVLLGFEQAGVAEHSQVQFFFEENTSTVSIFRPHIDIQLLQKIDNLYQHDQKRCAQVLHLHVNASGKPLRVYNSHQPCSDKHKYSKACRRAVFENLFSDGLRGLSNSEIEGFIIGGDLSMSIIEIMGIYQLNPAFRDYVEEPQAFFASRQAAVEGGKHGDFAISYLLQPVQLDCQVRNCAPDDCHDCYFAAWRKSTDLSQLLASTSLTPCSSAHGLPFRDGNVEERKECETHQEKRKHRNVDELDDWLSYQARKIWMNSNGDSSWCLPLPCEKVEHEQTIDGTD